MKASAVVLAGAIGFVARVGSASTSFPEAIKSALVLDAPPACSLCHEKDAAPVGPADRPFAKSLLDRGLVSGDSASLLSALDRMRKDGVDSDGDGARDLDELSWGGDPNAADRPENGVVEPMSYGCAFVNGGGSPTPFVWALVAVAVWGAVRRRSHVVPSQGAQRGP